MRSFHRRIRRAMGATLAVGLAGAMVCAIVVTYTKPDYLAFESAFWNHRAAYARNPAAARRARPENLDILTAKGWSGQVGVEQSSGRLAMNLVDFSGKAVPGLFVTARVAEYPSRQLAAHRVLSQDTDGVYRSDTLGLGKGLWDITLRADDPENQSGTALLFRVEKHISID